MNSAYSTMIYHEKLLRFDFTCLRWACLSMPWSELTHWGRVTHIWVGTNTNIGSDNGLSPGRRQAIIWTNAGTLLIGPQGTNFCGILSKIHTFSFKKMHLNVSSAKWRPFCLGLNVLTWSLEDVVVIPKVEVISKVQSPGPNTHCRSCLKVTFQVNTLHYKSTLVQVMAWCY